MTRLRLAPADPAAITTDRRKIATLLRCEAGLEKPWPRSQARWRMPLRKWKASDQARPNSTTRPRGDAA